MAPSTGSNRLANFFASIRYRIARISKSSRDSHIESGNWKWINRSSGIFILFFLLGQAFFFLDDIPFLWIIPAILLTAVVVLLFGLLIKLGVKMISSIPRQFSWISYAGVSLLFIFLGFTFKGTLIVLFYSLLAFIFVGGAAYNIFGTGWKKIKRRRKLWNIFFFSLGVTNLVIFTIFIAYPGPRPENTKNHPMDARILPSQLELQDPSIPGSFKYEEVYYSPGTDKHRTEFSKGSMLLSYTVDASAFIDGWEKLSGKLRSKFWGFRPDSLPLNGRVWLPEGEGPFPVIMIVHGNHMDRDFSDDGYGYLGELMASRGYLAVSVDENFLNSSPTNFRKQLKEESDARAWMLLKHLEFLINCGENDSSLFFNKPDMDNIILVGHSRGGEAVSVAACFNKLDYYPDNASQTFDFNFGIKGIVSIAQVDGQYRPSGVSTPLENLNYLGLHGSLDADVTSFHGLRQLNRLQFTDSLRHFKTALFIEGANHGQFNESWGWADVGYPAALFLDRRKMLSAEEQEMIAMVYISAFADASTGREPKYETLFRDYRCAWHWLPRTRYQNQYLSSTSKLIAGFDEDIDLTTASMDGVAISFAELSKYYEKDITLNDMSSGSRSLIVGWNNMESDSSGFVNFGFSEPYAVNDFDVLSFDLTILQGDPGDRNVATVYASVEEELSDDEDIIEEESESTNVKEEKSSRRKKNEDQEETIPPELLIQFKNNKGEISSLALTDFHPLNESLAGTSFKLKVFQNDEGGDAVPQHVQIPMEAFIRDNISFFEEGLESLRFIFNGEGSGMMAIDNINLNHTK